MQVALEVIERLLSISLTCFLAVIVAAILWGLPKMNMIERIVRADTKEGREDLARYMARKTGGKKIDLDDTWRSFIPAARSAHASHLKKRRELQDS